VQAQKELDHLAPHDEVALFTFSDRVETVVTFPAKDVVSAVSTSSLVRQRLNDLTPTWAIGDLGLALRTVAQELTSEADVEQWTAEPRIVVISDFQKGSKLEALLGFEWPPKLQAVMREVKPSRLSNATLHLLAADDAEPEALRVRVINAADSTA